MKYMPEALRALDGAVLTIRRYVCRQPYNGSLGAMALLWPRFNRIFVIINREALEAFWTGMFNTEVSIGSEMILEHFFDVIDLSISL